MKEKGQDVVHRGIVSKSQKAAEFRPICNSPPTSTPRTKHRVFELMPFETDASAPAVLAVRMGIIRPTKTESVQAYGSWQTAQLRTRRPVEGHGAALSC